jgi:ABC-type uncharacterized transport system auxiliary subunit
MATHYATWVRLLAAAVCAAVLSGCCTRHRTTEIRTKTTRTVSEQTVVQ